MTARHRFVGLLTILVGGALAAAITTSGCGGSTEQAAPDTGPGDTGIALVDSAKPDTGSATTDSASMGYDVPGSLFDADIPDIVFEGGKTAKGCYDCTLDKCKTEVEACDKDAQCRGLLLCVLTTCSSFSDTSCALGCAVEFGVTSFSDPVISKVLAVGNCNQSNCASSCPAVPDAGMTKSDASTKSDGASSETATAEAGMAFKALPPDFGGKKMSVDPRVIDALQSVATSFGSTPEARDGLIDRLAHGSNP